MNTYKVLAAMLTYPQADWLEALDELEQALAEETSAATQTLAPLFELLRGNAPIALQQNYVATFDQNPSHSLHLFEHVHGESRERGQAMVDLLQEYQSHGLEISAAELPDFVPLFLEYLSLLPEREAREMLGDAVHVLALIGRKLEKNGSPYHTAFKVLEALSPVAAEELPEQPVREMEETMETFGPGADGAEPLLVPKVAYADMPKSLRKAGHDAGTR